MWIYTHTIFPIIYIVFMPCFSNKKLFVNIQSELNQDNVDEITTMVAEVVQEAEKSVMNVELVKSVVVTTAMLVANDPTVANVEVKIKLVSKHAQIYLVFPQTVGSLVDVLNTLQTWPANIIQIDNNGAKLANN